MICLYMTAVTSSLGQDISARLQYFQDINNLVLTGLCGTPTYPLQKGRMAHFLQGPNSAMLKMQHPPGVYKIVVKREMRKESYQLTQPWKKRFDSSFACTHHTGMLLLCLMGVCFEKVVYTYMHCCLQNKGEYAKFSE